VRAHLEAPTVADLAVAIPDKQAERAGSEADLLAELEQPSEEQAGRILNQSKAGS
jgi:hypothetical protein